MYRDIQMPWVHGCTGAAHSPKNLSMALSAEVAEIVEHLTNHGKDCSYNPIAFPPSMEVRYSNDVGAWSTGTTQWLTEEQSKNLPKDKLEESFARCRFFVRVRQKLSKKRSLHRVNEHFETIFNAAITEKMLCAKFSRRS
jgi:hypothetical protein